MSWRACPAVLELSPCGLQCHWLQHWCCRDLRISWIQNSRTSDRGESEPQIFEAWLTAVIGRRGLMSKRLDPSVRAAPNLRVFCGFSRTSIVSSWFSSAHADDSVGFGREQTGVCHCCLLLPKRSRWARTEWDGRLSVRAAGPAAVAGRLAEISSFALRQRVFPIDVGDSRHVPFPNAFLPSRATRALLPRRPWWTFTAPLRVCSAQLPMRLFRLEHLSTKPQTSNPQAETPNPKP